MTIRNVVIKLKADKHARRWKIREAISLNHAESAISSAMSTGSIGHRNVLDQTLMGGSSVVLADVVQVNSDGTERSAYTESY